MQHGPRPIRGVSTSDTAFVDWFPFGPVGEPTRISSFDEFSQVFGGLHPQSQASYSIHQYFQQGGAVAWVVRAGMTADDAAFITPLVTAMGELTAIDPYVFNLLCIPVMANLGDLQRELVAAAAAFCEAQRAFLLVDPPASITTAAQMRTWLTDTDGIRHMNAAVYFPRLLMPDPLDGGRARNIGASGGVAGVYARTDAARGVWRPAAGIEATLAGVDLMPPLLGDADSAALNPLGINALRVLPGLGNVVWGARTLVGDDQRNSEWKYVPVRRTALFIEQSLLTGLRWVAFEPNDETLWAQIRLSVGTFMDEQFRRGMFQGHRSQDAYFVRCDPGTTSQRGIEAGVVNIVVGFAPMKPAEFIVIHVRQVAGQPAP